MNNLKKNENGITLVALVVTIIVLLILAGIAISLTVGNNGIFSRSKEAVEKYSEAEAREKLELALANIAFDKNIKNIDDDYIDNELNEQGMIVIGDIVIVDDWQFTIDRSVPKIGTTIGKGSQNEEIKITPEVIVREDYVNATMKLKLTYNEGTIQEIIINGERKQVPASVGGVYNLEDIVTENGIYTVLAKDEKGNYKIGKVEVKGITEDMEIWNKADMESFREKVNSGRTFEGRTARVMDNIKLAGSESDKWIPIGSETNKFKGTFEGNNHSIEGLYINNTNNDNQGLFGYSEGTIQNAEINGSVRSTKENSGILIGKNNGSIKNITSSGNINGYINIGGVVGWNEGTIEYCTNNASVTYNKDGGTSFGVRVGGIVGVSGNGEMKITKCINNKDVTGAHDAGGIVGVNGSSEINLCINRGSVIAEEISLNSICAGGIVGYSGWESRGIIRNCINSGYIGSNSMAGGIVGYSCGSNGYSLIENCYNIAVVNGVNVKGGILGYKGDGSNELKNNYWINTTGTTYGRGNEKTNEGAMPKTQTEFETLASILGSEYVNDEKNKNGTWKYNNGYPILKWQLENK